MRTACLAAGLLALSAPTCHAWGAAGHEIVATLAEIHLLPSVLSYIRSPEAALLPPYAGGHLAPIASWADAIRGVPEFRGWSGPLHYTGWEGDHPPEVCAWPKAQSDGEGDGDGDGDHGHWNSEHDVLHAIANYTSRLEADPTDWVSLRFLIHFLGDVHQPLHLTSRERGGNGDPVLWEGRRTNMHSLWDGLLIARALRETRNYTQPLPSRQIEDALTGRIYDPYIRLLLWEGVRSWWRDSLPAWLACTATSSAAKLPNTQLIAPTQQAEQLAFRFDDEQRAEEKVVICPFDWASETHRTTCALGFPANYDDELQEESSASMRAGDQGDESQPTTTGRLLEVGGQSPFYLKIRNTKAVERLLVQAGLRLAATLNLVLAPVAESAGWVSTMTEREQLGNGAYFGWLADAEAEAA
ncbi:hypothetical protein JCM10908_001833 [Rhodotorula pacifica]|uniref:S1/P1 nuclease n=1 Tax=Rhodotorula pacifica TaxID=1495444 RepID=UPI003170BAD7